MNAQRMTTLRRAFGLMEILADRPEGISFNQLRREFDNVAPATMSRLVQTLVADGYLARDEQGGRYTHGPRFLALSRRSLGIQSRRDIVQPELDRLAAATAESAAYFDLDGNEMELLAKTEVEDSYHYMELNRRWSPLPDDPFGWVCLPNPAMGHVEAAKMLRKQGVLSHKKMLRRYEALRVVAPVLALPDGDVIGSIGITAITSEIAAAELTHFCTEVRKSAQTLSRKIVN